MSDKLLTVEEASRFLSVNVMSIYRLAKKKVIPSLHIGKLLRFRMADLEKFIEGQVVNNKKEG